MKRGRGTSRVLGPLSSHSHDHPTWRHFWWRGSVRPGVKRGDISPRLPRTGRVTTIPCPDRVELSPYRVHPGETGVSVTPVFGYRGDEVVDPLGRDQD